MLAALGLIAAERDSRAIGQGVLVPMSLTADVDNVAALRKAVDVLSRNGSGTLTIPHGTYRLASAALVTPIMLGSNVVIDGQGSTLVVTGTAIPAAIFASLNASNVTIRNLTAIGNSRAVADAASGAFFNYVQDRAGAGAHGVAVENVHLENFAAERWISVLNKGRGDRPLRDIALTGITARSRSGNNLGGDDIAIGAGVIMIYGVSAPVIGVTIRDLTVDATFIKAGVTLFHRVESARIEGASVRNAGREGTANDKGAYAINIYGDPGELRDVTINDAMLAAPRSVGIYLRGAEQVIVNRAQISGQSDTVSTNLPKGAIAADAASEVVIQSAILTDNVHDITVAADTRRTTLDFVVRNLDARGSSASSILILPSPGPGNPAGFVLADSTIDAGRDGIVVSNNHSGLGRNIGGVKIERSRIVARHGSALVFNPNGGGRLAGYLVSDTDLAATNRGLDADRAQGDLSVKNVTISDASRGALNYGLIARGVQELHIDGLLVRDMATGYATATEGASGSIAGVRLENVANGHEPHSLGMRAPTGRGGSGWFVQSLVSAPPATGDAGVHVRGWRYSRGGWITE